MNTKVKFFYRKGDKSQYIITELDPETVNSDANPWLYTVSGKFQKKYILDLVYEYPECLDDEE